MAVHKKSKKSTLHVSPEPTRKNVNIQKASNGYVVSSFSDGSEKVVIAKTKKEAKTAATKMMGL